MGLLDKTPAEIAATRDSFVDLALALEPLDQQVREAEKRRAGAASRVRPRYAKALLAEAGGLVAPDANLTLRVTYGQVKARANASDGVDWRAFTTLAGIEKKHTGEGEFKAPDAELAAIKALRAGKASRYVAPELADVPVTSSRLWTPPAATRARRRSTAAASSWACSSTAPSTLWPRTSSTTR